MYKGFIVFLIGHSGLHSTKKVKKNLFNIYKRDKSANRRKKKKLKVKRSKQNTKRGEDDHSHHSEIPENNQEELENTPNQNQPKDEANDDLIEPSLPQNLNPSQS